ncbi:MAG: ABC transporter permease/substrate-binding protein, partial [Massilibacteroides sp.]|nr:ABC transporter permease/substrate-binding protein [Massilibacteroides sp.]
MQLLERSDYFLKLISQHLLISSASIILVTALGILIGVWVFYSSKARTIVLPVINFLYTIPSIAMFGLLIPLVGIGLNNALIVLVVYGLLPIVRNTYTGMKEVPTQLVEAAEGLGTTPLQLFKKIYFPLALPSILSGLRVTTVMIIALGGLAALIGAGGLGQAIFRGLNTMNTPLIVAGSLFISLFAILGDRFIGVFEKHHTLQRMLAHNATKKQRFILMANMVVLLLAIGGATLYLNPIKASPQDTIVVATKPTSEQFILGEIIAQRIENQTNLKVIRKFGIGGGTTNIHPAMLAKQIDLYPEYTGTAWLSVLKKDAHLPLLFSELDKEYTEHYDFKWLGLLGFNNTYTLAIPLSVTKAKHIQTFSDLALQSKTFILGAEFDFFEREDAYQGLIKRYPFQFKDKFEMDINLRYKAIEEGKVDVVDAFTTDAQINALNLKVLADDKHYFPKYEAGIVIRQEVL